VDRLERRLLESGQREVTSELLGRRVLDELSEIDVLAAVRFASVFRNFSSPSDYEAFFAGLSPSGLQERPSGGGPEVPVRSLRASR
jgi:transcriptional repressor NrdR